MSHQPGVHQQSIASKNRLENFTVLAAEVSRIYDDCRQGSGLRIEILNIKANLWSLWVYK